MWMYMCNGSLNPHPHLNSRTNSKLNGPTRGFKVLACVCASLSENKCACLMCKNMEGDGEDILLAL